MSVYAAQLACFIFNGHSYNLSLKLIFLFQSFLVLSVVKNVEPKRNGAGLVWESQSHCFADEFVITHAHSFGTDTQYDYS